MPPPIPKKTIKKSLSEKGFRCNSGERDHEFYYFYYNNKKTTIRTKISRGTKYKTYDINLLQLMKNQLRFNNLDQTHRFLSCHMAEEEYIFFLLENNIIHSS